MSDSDGGINEPPRKRPAKKLEKRLIVILEGASLETVLIDKKYQLLNCDKHKNFAKKNNRDVKDCRPDITHQCLLMLLDSPLNRAGFLQVFIRTEKNVLIEINPETRIPRTFERFCGLMVQLLQDHTIYADQGKVKLLRLIKNPVTNYLPSGCLKVSTSFTAPEVIADPSSLSLDDSPIVFVVGAFAKGNVNVDYAEKTISLSNYPLSAALACTKLCNAFEKKWGII